MKKLITLFSLALLSFNSEILAQCNDLSSAYNHSFENGTENSKWTILDNNSDGYTWETYGSTSHSNSGDSCLRYSYSFSSDADDWAFTPCLDLKTTDTYNLEFFLKAYSATYPEKMRVLLSQGTAPNSVVDTLLDETNIDWTSYQARSLNFTVPSNSIYYIAFECYSASGQWNLYIDDVNIRKVVPADAGAIKLTSSASDACDISSSESITIEFINYGSNSISSIGMSYSINGGAAVSETYTPATAIASGDTGSYTFSATADFSQDGTYNISGSVNLTGDSDASNDTETMTVINLVPTSAPYIIDFDTIADGSKGPYLDGVFSTSSSDFEWTIESSTTGSTGTGPAGDASGSGNYIYTEATGASSGDSAELKSQCIDLGSMANPTLDFKYHMYSDYGGDSMGDLHVMISTNGTNFVNLETISGRQDTSESDPWNRKKIDLTSYSGQTIYLNFIAVRGSYFTSDIALDDISIVNSYTNDLELVSAETVDASCGLGNEEVSVVIYNNGKNTVTSFDIGFSVNGGTVLSETYSGSLAADSTLMYTFANKADLSAKGDHEIEVILNFSNDEDASNDTAWADTEHYAPFDLTLDDYKMGFELDDANDLEELNKWTLHDLNADGSSWSAFYDVDTATNDTNYFMGYQYNFSNTADDWLISSCIDMRAGATYEISINSFVAHFDWGIEHLIVMMGTDNNPSSMTDTLIDVSTELDTTIKTFTDTFTAPISQSYYLGIKAASDPDIWYLYVDDAMITQLTESSINDKVLSSVNLYPNPANDFVMVDLSNIKADVHITNIEGQLIKSIFNSQGLVKVNTKEMNPGIYFVRIENESGSINNKLIVY